MSTISSGIGLVSGLPIEDLVDALIAIQQRPITQLQQRLGTLTSRRTALIQISAQLLSVQNAVSRLADAASFNRAGATSSDESTILATAGPSAAIGQYTFTVRNLAGTHQLVSSGFATRDATLVGAGTLTIETADALLNRSTRLSALNGGAGVRAGRIRITDRAGNTAEIDLRAAATIDDVVGAVNAQTAASVTARVEGDHLVLEDRTGLQTGDLVVAEVGAGRTAADLGLLVGAAAGVITGNDLVTLSGATRLDDLNDGNGVRVLDAQSDVRVSLADGSTLAFDVSARLSNDTPLSVLNHGAGIPDGTIRFTDRAGRSVDVHLAGATSTGDVVGDIQAAIDASNVEVTVTLSGSHLVVTDDSIGEGQTADSNLIVEDVGGTTAAALGIAGSSTGGSLTGDDIFLVDTIGDVLRVINDDLNNTDGVGGVKLLATVSADGKGLTLSDVTSGANPFSVESLNGSHAAEDLGLLGTAAGSTLSSRRLLAGLDTVLLRSLNGGGGVAQTGSVQLTDRSGLVATVDLSNAETLADVIDAINAAPTAITASVSSSGLGIALADTSGGTGPLVIEDLSGSTIAADLNVAFSGAASTVSSGNLQRQYISTALRLSNMNNGQGVPAGKFRITDSTGASAVVDLTQGDEVILRDVIDEINSRGIGVAARINDTGDGLLLEDTAGGGGQLSVAEEVGTAARALGILGTAAAGETFIDGSFGTRIDVAASDTLDDVLANVQNSAAQVNATIINDGTGDRPFRLNLVSATSGRNGQVVLDVGTTGLSFDTLMEARDATVLFGSPDADAPLVLTSSTNTLDGAIPGVRLDLVGPGDEPVTITVTQDVDAITSDLSSFVAAFNAAVSKIDEFTRFDSETETRAVLTGDATARRVRQRLIDMVNRTVPGLPSTMSRLSSVGVTLSGGSSLQFDEEAFRAALSSDPEGVIELFTHEETDSDGETTVTGFGGVLKDGLEGITESDTGLIPIREDAIQASEKLLTDRISQLGILLERRRTRLLAQFQAMEAAISQLQSQQTAISQLASLGLAP